MNSNIKRYKKALKNQSFEKTYLVSIFGERIYDVLKDILIKGLAVLLYAAFVCFLHYVLKLDLILSISMPFLIILGIVFVFSMIVFFIDIYAGIIFPWIEWICEIPTRIRAGKLPSSKEALDKFEFQSNEDFFEFLQYCSKAKLLEKEWYVYFVRDKIRKTILTYFDVDIKNFEIEESKAKYIPKNNKEEHIIAIKFESEYMQNYLKEKYSLPDDFISYLTICPRKNFH